MIDLTCLPTNHLIKLFASKSLVYTMVYPVVCYNSLSDMGLVARSDAIKVLIQTAFTIWSRNIFSEQ